MYVYTVNEKHESIDHLKVRRASRRCPRESRLGHPGEIDPWERRPRSDPVRGQLCRLKTHPPVSPHLGAFLQLPQPLGSLRLSSPRLLRSLAELLRPSLRRVEQAPDSQELLQGPFVFLLRLFASYGLGVWPSLFGSKVFLNILLLFFPRCAANEKMHKKTRTEHRCAGTRYRTSTS